MTVQTLPRTFTLRSTSGRPLTVNRVADLHRMAWARHTKDVRLEWGWLARQARLPHLERVSITVTPLYRSGRSLPDPGAVAPDAKAAIDGLVDAGVLVDDDGTHVLYVKFMPPRVCDVDGLEMELREGQ